MSAFHDRWTALEKRVQGYIELDSVERVAKENADKKGVPEMPVTITVPYTYATIATIVTYLVHTFVGRSPMFQVGSHNADGMQNAPNMETLLQYNIDAKAIVKQIFTWLRDDQIYGVGIFRTLWESKKALRTVRKQVPVPGMAGQSQLISSREEVIAFEGNDVEAIDPFLFFPDPRVPMTEVREKGEFVFWRSYTGRHELLIAQHKGELKYVERCGKMPVTNNSEAGDNSQRSLRAMGNSTPGYRQEFAKNNGEDYVQVDQGTCIIIPEELGLGSGTTPERWLFTILNKTQIVQAEPFDHDHDTHPVQVIESNSLGHGFGNLSTADYLTPIQDTVSWFLNSHIYNVRAALNNMFVVNPSMIEMRDLKDGRPGKLIRMKRSALGQDPRLAIQQLQVANVTGTHIASLETFVKIGDMLSAVTDNLRGIQDSGSRKTATEVRTSGEAAASRLASTSRLISAQGMVPLGQTMGLNYQQFMSRPFEQRILGQEKSILIGPEHIVGDFYYPVHDGTLPLDKIALLDTWKEIFMGMLQDPGMRQTYNIPKIFEWIAELGGARNISSFRLNTVPDDVAAQQIAAGNGAPING